MVNKFLGLGFILCLALGTGCEKQWTKEECDADPDCPVTFLRHIGNWDVHQETLDNIGFNQSAVTAVESPNLDMFQAEVRLNGQESDLASFAAEARKAFSYVADATFNDEMLGDCSTTQINPGIKIFGASLSQLRDPSVMVHRPEDSQIPEYPSDLIDTAYDSNILICLDCPKSERQIALVREIARFWAVQCQYPEDSVEQFVSNAETGFSEF